MRHVLRIGTFETNSSSVHTLVFMDSEIFEEWKLKRDLFLDVRSDCKELLTEEEVIRRIANKYAYRTTDEIYNEAYYESNNKYAYFSSFGYYTYPEWFEDWDCELDSDCDYYTSKSGDKIVAISKFGYSG